MWAFKREGHTYSLSYCEHFPTCGVDWDESGRKQLPLLCAVPFDAVQQLINTDLEDKIKTASVTKLQRVNLVSTLNHQNVTIDHICPTYLAEVMPVECQR